MPSLFLDNRPRLAGEPGLHALIVGVSSYRHLPAGGGEPAEATLGLQQLVGTARTAMIMARWLIDADAKGLLPVPLATIRLLLSPSPLEEPELVGIAEPATRNNFVRDVKDWRKDAAASNEELTFFYFAGHGVERRNADAVLLLSDFGDPAVGAILNNAVDVDHLFAGMAPTPNAAQQISRTQFYFFDACRTYASEFSNYEWEHVPAIWPVQLGGSDDRTAAAFFGASSGEEAYAQKDQTLFSRALIDSFERRAAIGPEGTDPRWFVTTLSLIQALPESLRVVNLEYKTNQGFAPGGVPRKATLVYLANPPPVDVEISVDPAVEVARFGFDIRNPKNIPVKQIVPIDPHPFQTSLPAGLYRLIAFELPPQTDSVEDWFLAKLPICPPWIAKVTS